MLDPIESAALMNALARLLDAAEKLRFKTRKSVSVPAEGGAALAEAQRQTADLLGDVVQVLATAVRHIDATYTLSIRASAILATAALDPEQSAERRAFVLRELLEMRENLPDRQADTGPADEGH